MKMLGHWQHDLMQAETQYPLTFSDENHGSLFKFPFKYSLESFLQKKNIALATMLALSLGGASLVQATETTPNLSPEQKQLRAIYQELVEINTTNSVGSCTKAAQAMAARLKSAGYSDKEVQVLVPPKGPQKGNLVARFSANGGSGGASKKPLLLLAHIDVVEAKREDWVRDPFKLVEEKGMFYARGASDDKAMAAIFVANMMQYKQEKLKTKRDLILALTCDEELIPSDFNGVEYLLKHHRPLIDAEFALNEGGSGLMDKNGKPIRNGLQAGEKTFQTFQLEITNSGGHSSQPRKDNAIYRLSDALSRLGKYDFPFRLIPTTRAYFETMSDIEGGQVGADMKAILREPVDQEALARFSASSPFNNSSVRTTCVATMVNAGHASNALPQRAQATVNCRILPGESVEQTQATLNNVIADKDIKITALGVATVPPVPSLETEVVKHARAITQEMWPGTPLLPTLSPGGTDGRFLNTVGIPTYGISGMFHYPEGANAHGLNEKLPVKSLYEGQKFLNELTKRIAQ